MRVEGLSEADRDFLAVWDSAHGDLDQTAEALGLSKETVRKKAAHIKACAREAHRIWNTVIRYKWVKEIVIR